MMLSFLFVAFGVLWVWSKHGSTERELLERQKEEAKYAYTLKVAEIQVSYPKKSFLLRGQTLCTDGCDIDRLENNGFVFNITDGKLVVINNADNSSRAPNLGDFDNLQVTQFGIDEDGRVFLKRITGYAGHDPHTSTYYLNTNCVAVYLLEEGRLKYLR